MMKRWKICAKQIGGMTETTPAVMMQTKLTSTSAAKSETRGTPLLCIILDVMLPGRDGWQILQSCKNHPDTADTPVLICSVLAMEELARSLGADGYLKKPPTRDALLATLRQWAG